ncbi:hypothetical protein [Streptomyces sp. NPDC057580]|uniref:hypothetical protein n=1 Tax=Streptomyces sp. NPDC057580 TaxID=3346173 RepID=UPI0036A1D63D
MLAQPTNTASPLYDADAATTDPNTRFVRANTRVSAATRSTLMVERLVNEHHARNAVQAAIKAAAGAPGRLLPQVAASRAAEDIQRTAAKAEAEHAGLPASEGELRAFIRAAYAYRDDRGAEAEAAGQDPVQARRLAVITMQAIVRAMAGEAS